MPQTLMRQDRECLEDFNAALDQLQKHKQEFERPNIPVLELAVHNLAPGTAKSDAGICGARMPFSQQLR